MSSAQPSFVDGILGMIVERRDALSELEAVVVKVRDVFSRPIVPVAVASLPSTPARAALPLRAPAPVTVAKAGSPRARINRDDVAARVGDFLDRQTRPTTMAAIVAHAKATPAVVRDVLDQMVAARTVVRTGTRVSLRIGRPEVMAETSEGD